MNVSQTVGFNMTCRLHIYCATFIFVLFFPLKVTCYEKTLRKIVRNQSKMVQRPFSDNSDQELIWKNISRPHVNNAMMISGNAQQKTVFHKMQRPKMTTILSSVETGWSKSSSYSRNNNEKHIIPNELRLARDTFSNTSVAPLKTDNVFNDHTKIETNASQPGVVGIETLYQIPSKFFSPVDEHDLQSIETSNSKANTIIFPKNPEVVEDNSSLPIKRIYVANLDLNARLQKTSLTDLDNESDKADFLVESTQIDAGPPYNYNESMNPYTCRMIKESQANINAQDCFFEFNIEPPWIAKKHFWNNIFDSRYESLMRNPKWPPLKVILVPRTHVDTIWKRSFDQYHNDTVSRILSNIVKKLQFYKNLTFAWNEVSHLSEWWKNTSQKSRSVFRKLVKGGRLEITTGGWIEPDEATTHLFGLVHQLIEGHQWLKYHLNYSPKTAWLTNSVSHSPTMPYLLSALDIPHLVLTNLHYSWEQYLAEFQYSDFLWLQNWDSGLSAPSPLNEALNRIGIDRHPKHCVLTHYLQFNSAGFKACGPNGALCATDFDFTKSNKNLDVNSYNAKEKSELLLEQYSKAGTLTPHNVIIAPIGGPYRFEMQAEFDYQYNNYQKIADFVNSNRNIYKATVEFGTPKDYFSSIIKKHKMYPTLKGDFANFADISSGSPAYWAGFFTSRPLTKILLRRLQSTLRTTEILFSFALSFNAFRGINVSHIFETLIKARENVARLLDRNVVSGTLTANALKYAHHLILTTAKNCWHIQEVAASLLSTKPGQNTTYLKKYVYRDGEFISVFKTVSPQDQIYIFNSLNYERTELVELITRHPNIRIVDHNKKYVTVQINPIWKYNSDNNVIKISRRFFKVTFVIVVPPMTLQLFKIKDTYDATLNPATIYCSACVVDDVANNHGVFPFDIQPIQTGDIQLENYKHRLIFDELTGFLNAVIEKETNNKKHVLVDYGAFRASDVNSGMFLFNTDASKPLIDILMPYRTGIKNKIMMIVSGQITTELTCVYGRLLQQTVKIFNLINSPLSSAIYIETKVDYEVSPKNRDLELFLSIETDITNGNSPQLFTDNNAFQYSKRVLNISRRIESNMYPITSMTYIQDSKSRLTIITDHAQGVTAFQEGQLVLVLDRRVLFNDGRGTNEGLDDNSATCHRHFLLLENFIKSPTSMDQSTYQSLKLPSLSATYLANSLNYLQDIFIIDRNNTDLCYYAFLPLIKASFPCDVTLINYRIILGAGELQHYTPNAALMTLHKQSSSCKIGHLLKFHCNGETNFSIDKILRNIKAVYQTNLAGTNKGTPILNFNEINFPPMELITLRIHF